MAADKNAPTAAAARRPVSEEALDRRLEWLGIVGLVGLAAYLLAVSWRRWNHPMVDFGRELYTPWRLSEGAVLYRDVDDVYGPFSQYFNAALFRVFGPGLMVLVSANLVILTAIVTLAYRSFRQAWGAMGALAGAAVFIAIFAFNQAFYLANFNYVTPYAHEATHGVLVCLGLVAALGAWLARPAAWRSFVVGVLAGLTWVIKPEFMLAAGAVTAVAVGLRWKNGPRIARAEWAGLLGGGLLPTALFAGYFACHLPLRDALIAAGRAWTSLFIYPEFSSLQYQRLFMGLDQPGENLWRHLWKSAVALALLGGLGYGTARALRTSGVLRGSLLAMLACAALLVGLFVRIDQIGACLLVLLLLYLAWQTRGLVRGRVASASPSASAAFHARLLLAVLAAALMARMLLNGRIVQFGFFQAALATMVLAALVFAESVEWMPAVRGRRWTVALVAAALWVPGLVRHAAISVQYQHAQTLTVGQGRDQFYAYPPERDPTGFNVNAVVGTLAKLPPGTLFSLPEGSMINYLSRRPSPLPQFQFYGFTTEGGREAEIVRALEAHPPDFIVIASRDLRDFGIAKYGVRDGGGRQIMQWIARRYTLTHRFDDDPLDSAQFGAYILQPKITPISPP